MTHAIRVHQTGIPEVLEWQEVEVGEPGPGQARIRQDAAGLNFIDVYHRIGLYPQGLPFTPGVEGAGVVEAIGEGVTGVKPGNRVAYAGPIGGYAEERLIEADRLVKLPDGISTEQAAAMMLQGMTAHMLLRSVHRVQPGETIREADGWLELTVDHADKRVPELLRALWTEGVEIRNIQVREPELEDVFVELAR